MARHLLARFLLLFLIPAMLILVACSCPALAQGSDSAAAKTGLSDQTASLPGPSTSVPLAVGRSLNGLADIVCEQNQLGKLKGLDETEVPDSTPLADELVWLAERFQQKILGLDIDPKSLTYLLFHSGMPSDTGIGNPFVSHTKGSHGTLPDGQDNLPSSREMDLAIKVLQSKGDLAPKDLMKMSLEVTKGDVPSALLTCHNFLKEVTWAQREGFSPTFLSFTPKGTAQEPETVADSTADVNAKTETKSEKKARAEALRKEYIKSFKKINDNFTVINDNGHLTVSLGSEDAALISDRLMNLRPADDTTNDKMGPWYHTFGVLFLGSTAAGGESTAKLWAEGEGFMRHYLPGFSSSPDAFKESLTTSAADEIGKIIKCLNEKPAPSSTGSEGQLGKIIGSNGAFVSRGNIKGGTDHLGFANCLCKCACSQGGWACGSGVACVYDANPKGECLCAGYGEGHTTVPSSGECYENCAREYGITGMQSNKTPLVPVSPSGYNPIMPGDLIQITGDTLIALKDGSKLLVKPGSTLNFISTESGKIKVDLLLGSFRTEHATGSSASAGGPDVKIADKTVRPKGTEFICKWDGASGKVSVVDGSVIIADETSEKTLEAGKQMDLPQGTVTDYNLSADDGGLVAGIPLRDLILDEGEPEPFGEYDPSFAGGKIPDDWLWQDPGSDAELDSAPSGGLKVTVPDGNEFWGYPGVTAGQRSDAPRLLHKVTGDFDLQGRVYLDTEATDLATVEFLYFSPGSYIGLKSGLMKQDLLGEHYNLPGGGWLRAGRLNKLPVLGRPSEVIYNGNSAELKSGPDAPDQPVFLKFTRRGHVLKTYHSLDGENWILSSREEVNVSQTLWVGWVFKRSAYDGLTDKTAIVTLDDVRLKTAKPGTLPIPEWDEILQAGSAEIDSKTVRLHLDGSGKGTTGVQKGAALIGDFQATVSFQAENKAPESGESRSLALVASNCNGLNNTHVGWFSDKNHVSQLYTTEFFSAGHGSDSAHDYTNDWSGKLRIVRQGGNISTYIWKNENWALLGNFQRGYPDPVYIGVEVSNEREAVANASMTVEFNVDEIIGNSASEIKTANDGETKTKPPATTGKTDDAVGKTDDATGKMDYSAGKTDDATGKTDYSAGKTNDAAGKDEGASAVKPEGESIESTVIFDNWNTGGVSNNPSCDPSFTISEPHMITYIDSYHWNDGSGTAEAGKIFLVKDDGLEFGPWQAEGQPGMNGVPNAFWIAHPYEVIPAGTYVIHDSDRETRSQNFASGGCGFGKVQGYADQSRPSDVSSGASTKDLPSNEPSANAGEASNPSDDRSGDQSGDAPKHWQDYANDAAQLGSSTPDDAELVFVVGDIDNLGFGWPEGFDVFSGNSAPVHSFPWVPDASDPAGTDRIMVGTSYDGHPPAGQDGYASSTSRPDNTPQFITIWYDLGETKVKSAVLQMFVDDFQSPVWMSSFQATINGRRAPFLEDVLNSLVQTGPIGKLITVQIPEEFLGELKSGVLTIDIDDPTTGAGDGFAVDFVRLLINPRTMTNTGTVSGTVTDEKTGLPINGAIVSATDVIKSSTDSNGEYLLMDVPAGLAAVALSKGGYVPQTKTADLTSGGDAELDFQCKKL